MFEYLITRPMGFIIEHIYNIVSKLWSCDNYLYDSYKADFNSA